MTFRYRKLDGNGDYLFGEPAAVQEFWIDQVEAIQQSILTRLQLNAGDWFLNADEGTPYKTDVFGFVPANVRDFAIRDRILGTFGVTAISSYQCTVNSDRSCQVVAYVDTIYGQTQVTTTL